MISVRSNPADYVKYSLKSETSSTFWLATEPLGWEDDEIELTRHKDYHGIMVSFTGELSFYGQAAKYIQIDFDTLGMNSNLELRRYVLRDNGDAVAWELDFSGIVDYTTYVLEDAVVKVRFNSNQLEEVLKTRNDDEFELERRRSIIETAITGLNPSTCNIVGIPLNRNTSMNIIRSNTHDEGPPDYWSRANGQYMLMVIKENSFQVPPLTATADTNDRISTPDTADPDADPASKMFFVDSTDPNVDVNTLLSVKFSFKCDFNVAPRISGIGSKELFIRLIRYQYNDVNLEYDVIDTVDLARTWVSGSGSTRVTHEQSFSYSDIAYNQGFAIGITIIDTNPFVTRYWDLSIVDYVLNVTSKSIKTPSENCEFIFVHDALAKLTEILTGNRNQFVSRLFGRLEENYVKDGKYGLIGLISGFWIRQFNDSYSLYKSMVLSMKDLIDSLSAVFNIGLGIEVIDGVKKIVVEDLKYFYQDRIVVTLDGEVSEPVYKVIKDDYFSSIEIGYSKGGDYEDTMGLDEPNVLTNYITPINKNGKKYRKVSAIRADDVGLEIIRRKPAALYPEEDTTQDSHIWFLDLKRDSSGDYVQQSWLDRLTVPPVGLSYAEDFRSFLFTPLRMLLRHGWIIRSCLEQTVNLAKSITLSSSKANQTLGMFFRGDDKMRYEGEPTLVADLDRPRTLPIEVSFKYPISEELLKQIKGKTFIEYQGDRVSIPNYYFKFEWQARTGLKQYGYLTSLKVGTNEWSFILANDKLIVG